MMSFPAVKKRKKEKVKQKYGTLNTIKYLISYTWLYDKGIFALFAGFTLCDSILPFIGIYMPKFIVGQITGNGKLETIILIAVSMGATAFVLNLAARFFSMKYGPRIILVRMEFMYELDRKVMTMDYESLENPETQNLIQRAMTSIGRHTIGVQGLLSAIFYMAGSMLTLFGYLAIIGTLNILLLTALSITVIIGYCASLYRKKREHYFSSLSAPLDRKCLYLTDLLRDYTYGKDIRVYNLKDWLKGKFFGVLTELLEISKKLKFMNLKFDTLSDCLSAARDLLCYAYLIRAVLVNSLSYENYVLYFATIRGFSGWFTRFLENLTYIQSQNAYINDYRNVMEMTSSYGRTVTHKLPEPGEMPCSVEFVNVSFKYPQSDIYVLKDLNLKIEKGERAALVGANGAGKTTMVKLMCGLYTPTEGKVLLNGKDINGFDRDEYFKLFSVVFQDVKIFPFTIAENIALKKSSLIDYTRVQELTKLSGLENKISKLKNGLDTFAIKTFEINGTDFSGGEAQKLALARAHYKDAPIIILDEPTAALDPLAEYELYKNFNDLTNNRTALYISHRLSSTQFCDKVIFLDGGSITETGKHSDLLLLNGKYAEMFNAQSFYYKDENAANKKPASNTISKQ